MNQKRDVFLVLLKVTGKHPFFAALIGKDRKMPRCMFIFVVANMYNCYNMGIKKRTNRKLLKGWIT